MLAALGLEITAEPNETVCLEELDPRRAVVDRRIACGDRPAPGPSETAAIYGPQIGDDKSRSAHWTPLWAAGQMRSSPPPGVDSVRRCE